MSLPLLSLRLPHHVELPGAPLRLAHPVKVLQKHVDLLGAYHLVLWRQRPVVCGDVGLYTGLPARGAPRKTFVFLVQNRGGGALRRSKTRKQNKQKNQNRAVETRRDETRYGVSQGTGPKPVGPRAGRGEQRGGAESGAAPETRVPADACSSGPAAPVGMHPRRRGDEEVPLTLMLPAAAAGREDLRLDVVGARLEKFEALRDGKFEMKDMVPCSGLEPLQSASMVASWPRRCAALRAVCLVETHAPLVHEPSEKSGNVRSLTGRRSRSSRTRKIKNRCYVLEEFSCNSSKRGAPHSGPILR